MNHRAVVLILFIAFSFRPAFAGPTTNPAVADLTRDLYYLASDELEGRGVGTKGLDLAADYIAERFKSLKLQPLPGCEDYFQRFGVNAAVSLDPQTVLKTGDKTFEADKQYRPTGFSADGEFAGPVVFVGYGISNPQQNYDDYAGIDVKGKIVLMLRYEPHNEEGNSRFVNGDWSRNAALDEKAKDAVAHGAAALLLVNPPKYHEGEGLLPLTRGGAKSAIPFVHVKREVADALLSRGGQKDLQTLQTEIDTSLKPQSFELKDVEISGSVKIRREKTPVKNVMAFLPGTTHVDEFVIVGGHYDHLGHGGGSSRKSGSDEIHNGADDNASGTTAVLALAQRIVAEGPRDRSIVFICFTAEEAGLLGSQHFVDHPPIALEKVFAMLNMDMVGHIRSDTLYIGGGGTAEAFDEILKQADDASPLKLTSIGKGGRGPSDHQSFSAKRIPILFLFSGMHMDYHRPSDDADKINYEGIEEVVEFANHVVDSLATMPRQQYVAKYDSLGMIFGAPVTLGVVPDYGTDESTTGVRISGTVPGTPAEAAGFRSGDIIVQIGNKKVANLYDLSAFLARGKAGQTVTIIVDRDSHRVELSATLIEKKG